MAAIAESGRTERNDIIDWLRHQGFQFSWASWLERIHHNGGRLIYAGTTDQMRTSNRQPTITETNDEPPSRERPSRDWPILPPAKLPARREYSKSAELKQKACAPLQNMCSAKSAAPSPAPNSR